MIPLRLVALFTLASAPQGGASNAAAELLHWSADDERVMVIGEVHGTREIPMLAGDLAALLLDRGPVLVALELPVREQARIDRFLSSDGGSEARQQLLDGAFWRRSAQDGRSSRAMMELIDALRRLRGQGADLRVLAFDESDDARAAALLHEAVAANRDGRTLVLLGNYRASRNSEPPTLISRIADLGPYTVDVTAWSGDYWTCSKDETMRCGRHTLESSGAGENPLLHSDKATRARGFDQQLILPSISASVPAGDAEAR